MAIWMRPRTKALEGSKAVYARSRSLVPGPNECSGLHGDSRERLEFLAWLEAHSLTGRDVDLLSGARVAADARLARFDVEDAEAAQFDALSTAERILHGFEDA